MLQFLTLLQTNSTLAMLFFGTVGLCVGSFLNVLIYRLPRMMIQEWREEATSFISQQADLANIIGNDRLHKLQNSVEQSQPYQRLTLSKPSSHCPNCQHKIACYDNIPLISWLILAGKCRHCEVAIGVRYPMVEAVTAVLSALVIHHFGVSGAGISALILVWGLIALAGIDWDTQLLPDRLTFPLAGLGLLINTQTLFTGFVSSAQSVWGLIIGFLCLWAVGKLFYFLTKKQGMGQGDFKLLAVMGAWLGVWALPLVVLLSSVLGAVVGIGLMLKRGESRPFAFGPYIAMAGVFALLYGRQMMGWYLGLFL